MINLSAAGLNDTEANVYKTLLSKKEWRPTEIAKIVGESRTNTYKILDDLTKLGLAEKYDKNKKIHYKANHPSRLLELAQERRTKMLESEKVLETNAQNLLSDYIKTHEQPGVQFYTGFDGLKYVYEDQVRDKHPVYFILTPKAITYYGFERMTQLRMLAAEAKIPRYALTPDNTYATNYESSDKANSLFRTWLKDSDYNAAVEWGVYGDKVYLVTFGEEAITMIIDSPMVAESFMQIFKLLKRGQKLLPDYSELPKLASK